MLELIESKIITVWGRKKSKKPGKKDERFKIKLGIRLTYNDGVRALNHETGVEEIGRGTTGFFHFRYGTMNWKPAQRVVTDKLLRPVVDNIEFFVQGEKQVRRGVIFQNAEMGSKNDRGLPPEKFAEQDGFARRVFNDFQAFLKAQDSLAEEEVAEAA